MMQSYRHYGEHLILDVKDAYSKKGNGHSRTQNTKYEDNKVWTLTPGVAFYSAGQAEQLDKPAVVGDQGLYISTGRDLNTEKKQFSETHAKTTQADSTLKWPRSNAPSLLLTFRGKRFGQSGTIKRL